LADGAAHVGDPIIIGNRAFSREDTPSVLGSQLEALPRNVRETRRVPLGVYRGLRLDPASDLHAGKRPVRMIAPGGEAIKEVVKG
jgi:hypothetical protein